MVQVKVCKGDDSDEQHYFKYLPVAKQRLTQYPLLSEIFTDFFKTYENKYDDQNQNFILKMCMPYIDFIPIPNGVKGVVNDYDYDKRYRSVLDDIEYSLNIFAERMTRSGYDEFKNRLTDRDHFVSSNAVNEILTAYYIGKQKQIGYHNVDFQYKLTNTGKKPDILITLPGNNNHNHKQKQLFLELTSLTTGDAGQKIKNILHDFAAYILGKSQSKNFYLNIHFKLRHLLKDNKGHIDEESSKSYLKSWSDRLYLHELVGCSGRIEFERHLPTNNEIYVIDLAKPRYDLYIPLNKRLCDMIASQRLVNEWANKVKIDDFSKSIFLSASYGIGQAGKCVYVTTPEIDTNDPDLLYFDPIMETSRLVKQAFVDHINRSVKSKNKEEQLEEGKPVIIAIKTKEWRLNFEEEHKKFLEIKEAIQNEMKQFSDISGVIIFRSDLYLYNGRYIENMIANSNIQITECELHSLGIIKVYRTTES
jgi:hypothetical protein